MGPIRSAALGRPLESLGLAREADVAVVKAGFVPVGRPVDVPGRPSGSLAPVREARLAVPEADILVLGARDTDAEAPAADLVLGWSSRSLARGSEARLEVPDILILGALLTGEAGATSLEERAEAVVLRDAVIEVLGRSLASLGQLFEGDVVPLVEARVSAVEGVGRAITSLARVGEPRVAADEVPVPPCGDECGDEGGLTITTIPLFSATRRVLDAWISASRIGSKLLLSDGSSPSAIGTCNAGYTRQNTVALSILSSINKTA